MAKTVTEFVCQSCGQRAPKWMGKCPGCEAWNTLAEERIKGTSSSRKAGRGGGTNKAVQPVTQVESLNENRLVTGIGEFDRTLGGGLVEGSLVLIGGEPGIGKSTLLLQGMGEMAKSGAKVLYVSGEESPSQIKLRADRLGAIFFRWSSRFNRMRWSLIPFRHFLQLICNPLLGALVRFERSRSKFSRTLRSGPCRRC